LFISSFFYYIRRIDFVLSRRRSSAFKGPLPAKFIIFVVSLVLEIFALENFFCNERKNDFSQFIFFSLSR